MIRISIANPGEFPDLPFARLREIGTSVLEGEGVREAKISLAFVDDTTSARINMQFLQHEGPTDVITFPMSKPAAKKLEGELVIGTQVAVREAEERGHSVHEELFLYTIHGLLHLCGYDDRTAKDTAEMRRKEREYLQKLQLPDIAD
jgi:probable rRNA maturation factor